MRPEAVPRISREVPEKEELREMTLPSTVMPWPADAEPVLRSVEQENLLRVSSQRTFCVEASQSVRPAPSKEETQREAPEAEPSQTRVPEDVRESWAWRMRPEAVPMISSAVPEKEVERLTTSPLTVIPCPATTLPPPSVPQVRRPLTVSSAVQLEKELK